MIWITHAHAGSFMPTAATGIAGQVSNLYGFLLVTSFIACAILIGGMVYFVAKYKRKTDSDKTAYISHNTFLEFLWSFIPLVIFMICFGWGWQIYHDMRTMPENSLEVHVFGKQWNWLFQYKSGKKSANEFYVPVNRDVKLIMTSEDVIHSFYVPSFRIKQDVVPGRYTALWFHADKLGEFNVFCAEFCGTSHSGMLAKIKVVSQEEFDKWLSENDDALSLPQKGAKLYNEKGCVGCHSVDGSVKVGPSFKGIWGKTENFEGGASGVVDEGYVRESMLLPAAKIVKGFPNAMPSFQGQVSEEDINALIEYIKTLKN